MASIHSSFDQFTALQKALSELNYSQPLLRESVPLVQAIFTDLIEVTKKYTQVRKQSALSEKELKSQLNPIKIENDNLTKSNNTLHQKIIQSNDEFQAQINKYQKECEALKLERNEINILLNQKKHKIKNQELMINNLKKKMNAVISANGTTQKQLIGKTSGISFNSNTLSPSASIKNGNISDDNQCDDKYSLLENENHSLLQQIKELTAITHDAKERISELEHKLKARNDEMERINDSVMIDDNRIKYIQHKQQQQDTSEKIKHLESQIEVLQNELIEKEVEIEDDLAKDGIIEKLKEENKKLNHKLELTWHEMDKLKVDLSSIKHTSNALKLEKKYDVLKSTKKLSKNVSEITLLHNKIEDLTKKNKILERKLQHKHKQHSILSGKNKEESSSNHTLNVRLEMKEKEIDKLRMEQVDFIQTVDEFKQKMKEIHHKMEIDKNTQNNLEIQLKSTENKLQILRKDNLNVSEKYEDLKKLNAQNQETNKELNRSNDENKFKVKCLQKENEAMNERMVKLMEKKNNVEKLETKKDSENFELVKKIQSVEFKCEDLQKEQEWNQNLLLQSQTKISVLEKDKNELRVNIERVNKELDAEKLKFNEVEYKYNSSMKQCHELEDKLKQCESMIMSLKAIKSEYDVKEKKSNALELEMIEIKNENERLNRQNKIVENNNKRKEDVITKVDEEKHSLKLILQQMQQRIAAFQQRLGVITKDRDHIKKMYDDTQVEMNAKHELISTQNINLRDLKTEYTKLQNIVKDVSKRNNDLQDQYNKKEHLAQSSMTKIKEFNNIQDTLSAQLREEMEDKNVLKSNLREISKQRDEIIAKYDTLRSEYNDLKDIKMANMSQELVSLQLKNGELKVLCNKLDDGHKNAQIKVEDIWNKNKEMESKISAEQSRFNEISQKLAQADADKENMQMALETLVTSHDNLQNELDRNAEIIQSLNHNISAERSKNEEFQSILSATQQKYRMQQKQLMEFSSKLKHCHQIIEKLQKQVIPQLQEENRLKSEQLKNSMNDITNITKENQFLNNEYSVTITDRDTKNKQLSSALNKMLYLESQCKNVESEKQQILENYKAVVLENEKLHKISEILDKNKSEFNMKISVLEQHIARRDHRIKHLERNLTDANMSNHELQRQNQTLTRDLERTNINNSRNEKMSENLQKDLECLKSDVVQKQLNDLEKKNKIIIEFKKENDNLQKIINELNLEKECALNSLSITEDKMQRLEDIINALRTDSVSNTEFAMKGKDETNKLKVELNQMKDLNQRLNHQLHKIQTS